MMKRKYEVAYYEHGLTKRISRKFFTALAAISYFLYAAWKHGKMSYTTIYEIK